MRKNRIEQIEDYILSQKTVTLDKLCEKFGVSKNTLRRDIDEIVSHGNIKKIYGGVSIKTNRDLLAFDVRMKKWMQAKQKIAAKAAEMVSDGDVIFIDSGTTTCWMIDYLKQKQNLTILTNNLEIILKAIPYEHIEIISLSGTLSRKTFSFTGQSVVSSLQGYNINKAFMACTGLSIENGATHSSPLEYAIKNTVVQRSGQVFLLADSSKFDVVSLLTFCNIEQVHTLVTDHNPPERYLTFFQGENHNLFITEED